MGLIGWSDSHWDKSWDDPPRWWQQLGELVGPVCSDSATRKIPMAFSEQKHRGLQVNTIGKNQDKQIVATFLGWFFATPCKGCWGILTIRGQRVTAWITWWLNKITLPEFRTQIEIKNNLRSENTRTPFTKVPFQETWLVAEEIATIILVITNNPEKDCIIPKDDTVFPPSKPTLCLMYNFVSLQSHRIHACYI